MTWSTEEEIALRNLEAAGLSVVDIKEERRAHVTQQHKLIYHDNTHSYWLNGKRAKSGSAIAKLSDDNTMLNRWRERMIVVGMTRNRRLVERAAVDLDNKEMLNDVARDAFIAAEGDRAAERGTQRHKAAELFDLGDVALTDQQQADMVAWAKTLDHFGITPLPGFVESFVAYPDRTVVGRLDRLVEWSQRPGEVFILDLKSGLNAIKYPKSAAIQLAIYANAPMYSRVIDVDGDKSTVTDWLLPPDNLNRELGLVIVLADDMERGELYAVDIKTGWIGAQRAMGLLDWRKGADQLDGGMVWKSDAIPALTTGALDPHTVVEGEGIAPQAKGADVSETADRLLRQAVVNRLNRARTVDELNAVWKSSETWRKAFQAGAEWAKQAAEVLKSRRAQISEGQA